MSIESSQVQQSKRRYPGEKEAADIMVYLRSLTRECQRDKIKAQELMQFANLLIPVVDIGVEEKFDPVPKLNIDDLEDELVAEVTTERKMTFGEDGLVLHVASLRGKAAFGLMRLLQMGRLNRLKICKHCGALFFKRFKRQRFCSDAVRKCQWNDYHSSEWRKKNREKNREHQRNYRKRLFGERHRGQKTS
jgi:hypothetical protein